MSYPESKHLNVDADKIPGPANYLIVHEFIKNDSPAFSMGRRSKPLQTEERPGPNRYYVEKFKKPGASTAPAFSMGKRIERVHLSKGSPGPAAYMPTLPRNAPSHSMSKRTKDLKGFTNPAPNAHVPPSNQTEKGIPTNMGICFKGRPTPWMYSGFRTTNLTEATSA
ncbi:outer dense fiber protein 3-like protein 2 [Patella vulgata]|uniref:outer dense fiber protein 3-like protein 2 n=1 Tax=Patella vulgata TaxID=6465 RepID=UPI0024A884E0|nr:outer dense fiber protein 3-like protein 2 [Patella vulgata]